LLDDCQSRIAATLVYSHHWPGLPNMMVERLKANPFRYMDVKEQTDAYITEYLRLHNEEIKGVELDSTRLSKLSSMEYRILLSCLVDADYSDTVGGTACRVSTSMEATFATTQAIR